MDRERRVYALLAYGSLLCLVPLLQRKDDPFILFHGRQGLALFFCEMAVFLASILLPFLMKPLFLPLFLLSFWGMVAAVRGETVRLPLIHPLSERFVL